MISARRRLLRDVSALFPDDKALVRRLLEGDEGAFSEFFDLQAPRIYRFALSRLDRDGDAAEEVVQLTLIRVFAKLHTYRAEAPLFTWLCTFCRREIGAWYRDKQRSRKREALLTDHEEVEAALQTIGALPFEDPQRKLLRRELADLVQSTLDCLPRGYGQILEWKYVEGLSVDEIAERLEVGFLAAQSRLGRARSAFRSGFGPVAPSLAVLGSRGARS